MAMRYYICQTIPNDLPVFETPRSSVFITDCESSLRSVRYIRMSKSGPKVDSFSRGRTDTPHDIASQLFKSSRILSVQELVIAAIPFRLPSLISTLYHSGQINDMALDVSTDKPSSAIRRSVMPWIHQMAKTIREGANSEGLLVESFVTGKAMANDRTPEDDIFLLPRNREIQPTMRSFGVDKSYIYNVLEPYMIKAFSQLTHETQ